LSAIAEFLVTLVIKDYYSKFKDFYTFKTFFVFKDFQGFGIFKIKKLKQVQGFQAFFKDHSLWTIYEIWSFCNLL